MKILFVTNNSGKFEEVQRWIHQLAPEIDLNQAPIDLIEFQSLDIHEIAVAKAQQAWEILHEPLLIDDGGIYFKAYNKFPGPLAKYVYEGIGLEGIWKLACDDPRTYFLSCLVYKNSVENNHIFEGICDGSLINPLESSFKAHATLPYTKMMVPEGSTKTLAQLRGTEEEKQFHHRYKALKAFIAWFRKHKV